MPNYDYLCSLCNSVQEIYQSFDETKVPPVCCNHDMKRIYTPNGLIFKGKGFYKTGG